MRVCAFCGGATDKLNSCCDKCQPKIRDLSRQAELEEILRDVITVQLGASDEMITPDARLAADLGADSLDMVEILMALEELGIVISDDEYDAAGATWRSDDFTFEKFVALVKKHQEAA